MAASSECSSSPLPPEASCIRCCRASALLRMAASQRACEARGHTVQSLHATSSYTLNCLLQEHTAAYETGRSLLHVRAPPVPVVDVDLLPDHLPAKSRVMLLSLTS